VSLAGASSVHALKEANEQQAVARAQLPMASDEVPIARGEH
jgi:hypothetical protein